MLCVCNRSPILSSSHSFLSSSSASFQCMCQEWSQRTRTLTHTHTDAHSSQLSVVFSHDSHSTSTRTLPRNQEEKRKSERDTDTINTKSRTSVWVWALKDRSYVCLVSKRKQPKPSSWLTGLLSQAWHVVGSRGRNGMKKVLTKHFLLLSFGTSSEQNRNVGLLVAVRNFQPKLWRAGRWEITLL